MTLRRHRRRPRRRISRAFLVGLAAALERSADDSVTFCACADGSRCVA